MDELQVLKLFSTGLPTSQICLPLKSLGYNEDDEIWQ